MNEKETLIRMTTKLLRDVLAVDGVGCRSDVKEELKTRLARMRIPYNLDTVEGALERVEMRRSTRPHEAIWTRR